MHLLTVYVRYLQSACQPSRKCSQRCILSAQTVQWTESSDIHSRAFQRSPTVSHIAGMWPSPLNYTDRKKNDITPNTDTIILIMECVCDVWHFKNIYLEKYCRKHIKSQPISTWSFAWSALQPDLSVCRSLIYQCVTAIISVPGKFSQRTSMGVFRFVSPIFWYRSFNVSACRRIRTETHSDQFWCIMSINENYMRKHS